MSNTNNYKINPCKSCKKNYDITDINSINQCCYNTLGAFEGTVSLNDFRNNPESINCQQCISESMHTIDRTPCDLRMTAYPQWIQTPHYFPGLLEQEGDVNTAKNMCLDVCRTHRYPNECSINCKIDSDAVESVENYTYNMKKYGDKNNPVTDLLSNDYFFISIITIGCIIAIFIIVYILVMFQKK